MAYLKAPNMSIWEYDWKGHPTGEFFTPIESYQGLGTEYFNPVAIGTLSKNDTEENRTMNNFTFNYHIAPWVRFMQVVSFQYVNQKVKRFLPHNAIGADWLETKNNEQYERNRTDTEIITRSQLFFSPRLGDVHFLSGMLMFETDQVDFEYTWSEGGTGPTTNIQDPASNPVIRNIKSGSGETHIIGLLGNLNYKFRDRYITSLNLRGDASSRFGSNNRWGIFPSASIAWRFHDEPWLQGLNFITDSKLRFSYGLAGKQPSGAYDRHAIFNTLSPSQYIDRSIVVPQQVQLANLKWQTLKQSNLGLELFLINRIDIVAEVYSKTTEDLLWRNYDIPYASGFNRLRWFNGGQLKNEGWEFSIDVTALRRQNLNLRFNFNIANNRNTFMEFPQNFNNEIDLSIGNGKFPRRAQEGQPIGSFYGFRYLGVWPSTEDVVALNEDGTLVRDLSGEPIPLTYKGTYKFLGGDAIYEDVNHDGKIDLLDVVYLGDSNPDFIGGMGFHFSWKDFTVFSQFHYRIGHEIVNEVAMRTEGMLDKNNQSKAVLHRWRAEGQDEPGMLPRAYIYHPANNLGSSRYVETGDYLRLVNLTVKYGLPKRITQKMRIRDLDFALTMRRTFTFTRYTGQDPEISQKVDDPFWFGTDKARTPPPREITFMMMLGF
jgi:TonB-linked SusC/RagA family outer membrane protein